MQISIIDYEPSKSLYKKVRLAFFEQEDSLNAWCKRNNRHLTNVKEALYGTWDGPTAKALRKRLIEESGLAAKEKAAS